MKTDTFRGSERGLGVASFVGRVWNLVETSLCVQFTHSEREILIEFQKLGLKVFRHPRSTGMVVGSASTVRSYSPDNMNESCAPAMAGWGLLGI